MNRFFFFDVDTQRDFMLPGGALYVAGAERIIPRLRRLMDCARSHMPAEAARASLSARIK